MEGALAWTNGAVRVRVGGLVWSCSVAPLPKIPNSTEYLLHCLSLDRILCSDAAFLPAHRAFGRVGARYLRTSQCTSARRQLRASFHWFMRHCHVRACVRGGRRAANLHPVGLGCIPSISWSVRGLPRSDAFSSQARRYQNNLWRLQSCPSRLFGLHPAPTTRRWTGYVVHT